MNRRSNSKRDEFLNAVNSLTSLDTGNNDHTLRCKFNFSYFTVQAAGQEFSDWSKPQLEKLLESLQEFSKSPLSHWRSVPVKGGPPIFSVYGNFPNNSEFSHPPHVPHQVEWGRFRLGSAVRLVGFVLPASYSTQLHSGTKTAFDCNTFYVVFLDRDHKFYKTERQ
jgi:hypothetical protein